MSTNNHAPTSHGHHHAHHFKDAMHEFISSKEGIWLFMVTEILMFGGLFVGYMLMHAKYPEMFAHGATFLDYKIGAINTAVLILSSWTMAKSIQHIQMGENSKATIKLALTLVCGAVFLIIKWFFEYQHKIHVGLFPGHFFHDTGGFANLKMYFGFYFSMSGLHALHVIIGMSLIAWVMIRNMKNEFDPHYYTAVEGVGLFWHIVDLVWIFLFPLLYLVG